MSIFKFHKTFANFKVIKMKPISNDRLWLSVEGRKELHNICMEKFKEKHNNITTNKSGLRTWILEEHKNLTIKDGSLSDSSLKKLLSHINMEGELKETINGEIIYKNQPYTSNLEDLARSIGYHNHRELKTQINNNLKIRTNNNLRGELYRVPNPQNNLLKNHNIEIHFKENQKIVVVHEDSIRYKIKESNIEFLPKDSIIISDTLKINEPFKVSQLLDADDNTKEKDLYFDEIIEIKLLAK